MTKVRQRSIKIDPCLWYLKRRPQQTWQLSLRARAFMVPGYKHSHPCLDCRLQLGLWANINHSWNRPTTHTKRWSPSVSRTCYLTPRRDHYNPNSTNKESPVIPYIHTLPHWSWMWSWEDRSDHFSCIFLHASPQYSKSSIHRRVFSFSPLLPTVWNTLMS